jgi:hypothetical protein
MTANDRTLCFIQLFSIGAVFLICDSQNVCCDARKPAICLQQPRDCMQPIRAVENALIVTRALRTRHLDGSHGVRDGG